MESGHGIRTFFQEHCLASLTAVRNVLTDVLAIKSKRQTTKNLFQDLASQV